MQTCLFFTRKANEQEGHLVVSDRRLDAHTTAIAFDALLALKNKGKEEREKEERE